MVLVCVFRVYTGKCDQSCSVFNRVIQILIMLKRYMVSKYTTFPDLNLSELLGVEQYLKEFFWFTESDRVDLSDGVGVEVEDFNDRDLRGITSTFISATSSNPDEIPLICR